LKRTGVVPERPPASVIIETTEKHDQGKLMANKKDLQADGNFGAGWLMVWLRIFLATAVHPSMTELT